MSVTLSAFGDEVAADLEEQLETLRALRVPGLDLRAAWGINVLQLDDARARRARELCDRAAVRVSCLGSPVGKSPLTEPLALDLARIERLIELGSILGTRRIRIFSWYPSDRSSNAHYDQYVAEVTERLATLTEKAALAGFTLLHENEREIIGDTPARCLAFARAIDSPHFRLIWDPANFVQIGIARVTERHFAALAPWVALVHVKDARLADRSVTPAGQGDGQLPQLLAALHARGFAGTLALEPHLKLAGHSFGFSGPEGMSLAVNALRSLLPAAGLEELGTT